MKTSTTNRLFIATVAIAFSLFFNTVQAQSKAISFNNISVNAGTQWLGTQQVPFKKVMLSWALDANVLVKSVEVESSFDMITFNTVTAGVQAISAGEKFHSYVFEDASAALVNQPVALYRVKVTDVYGKVTYTETKLVALKS